MAKEKFKMNHYFEKYRSERSNMLILKGVKKDLKKVKDKYSLKNWSDTIVFLIKSFKEK